MICNGTDKVENPALSRTPFHYESFKDFELEANQAFRCSLPTTQSLRYSKVFVLLLQWQEDSLGVDTEIQKLKNIFREQYCYQTVL